MSTEIVWYRGCEDQENLGMFPYREDEGFFLKGPGVHGENDEA